MFKGIYNEAEFYTNFYFDTKLAGDLESKIATFEGIKDQTDKLKGLDSFYWLYRDAKPANESLLEFYQKILTVLGYQFDLKIINTLKETSFNSVAQVYADERTNLYVFLTNEFEEGTFESSPLSHNITENLENREISEIISEFFDELESPPKWILIGSPTTMFLLERNRWAFGKYIKFSWDEIFQQKTEALFSSILGLISKESLCPVSGQSIHTEIEDSSHRHAFEVTTELRESVRESIELLINEMIYQKKEKHQAHLSKIDSSLYAKELSHDALFYAYRLIFLLFLEAQAEDSELLPLKSEIYRHGYSLEKLLELIHDIPDEQTADYEGTFAFESLQQIFSLIYNGFNYEVERDLLTENRITHSGFLLKGIKSDLFSPDSVKHLKDIKLRNGVMLIVLRKLSLISTGKGRSKQLSRVSYSNLGINQLGAVYEGLLSYSGFFAQEDLHALKPAKVTQADLDNGKELDQIYLAPKSIVDKYSSNKERKYKLSSDNYVIDDNGNPKIYRKGSFVYRLAGRDRQKLASYYTPESLTKCTVKYSLKVLFENRKTLTELWEVKILEPAMGSGAFLNEAVNQIAEKILELETQEKVKDYKAPKDKQKRLWEIKYALISKNVYGVDLNPTAIELARFSLWLNCIGAGMEPPRFDGRLKIGNSLIGARFKKGLNGIYPWLLLEDGMMKYEKRLKDYIPLAFEKIQNFRMNLISSKIDPQEPKIKILQGKAESVLSDLVSSRSEKVRNEAYAKLKLCGDIWCSIFFLRHDDLKIFPKSHEELLSQYSAILDGNVIEPNLIDLVQDKFLNERFFHWEIEFPSVISVGGFDLILGNPPWLAIGWEDSLYVSDVNPVPVALELNASQTRLFVDELNDPNIYKLLSDEFIRFEGYSSLLETDFYHKLHGVQKNTYKAFDILGFYLLAKNSVFGVIQEDGVLEDKKSDKLREEFYNKYCYHFQFQNEKKLFAEIGNPKRYSINIFSNKAKAEVSFDHIGNLFLSSTIDSSFLDNEDNPNIPLVKNESDLWDTRGHRKRIIKVTNSTIKLFEKFLNDDGSNAPVFLNLHSEPLLDVLAKISDIENDFEGYCGAGNIIGSQLFHETNAQEKGFIVSRSERPSSIDQVILSGPHINTCNPLSKETRVDFKSKFSYDENQLSSIADDFIPRTLYQPLICSDEMNNLFPKIGGKPYRDFFKFATRNMINPTNERCMFSVILPPGVSHIFTIESVVVLDRLKLLVTSGLCASLLFDGIFRLKNRTHFLWNDFKTLPINTESKYLNSIARRFLALVGLTIYYNDLWKNVKELKQNDSLLDGRILQGYGSDYNRANALREPATRDQAMVEIDALTALSFNLKEEELVQVYEILFPVLSMYDRKRGFNRKAKLIESHRFFKQRGW